MEDQVVEAAVEEVGGGGGSRSSKGGSYGGGGAVDGGSDKGGEQTEAEVKMATKAVVADKGSGGDSSKTSVGDSSNGRWNNWVVAEDNLADNDGGRRRNNSNP